MAELKLGVAQKIRPQDLLARLNFVTTYAFSSFRRNFFEKIFWNAV